MEMKQMSEHVFERIYEVVKRIPKGKVATYGQVAAMAGNPRWARVVGYALHVNPDPEHIPCFRVVNRFGEVSCKPRALRSQTAKSIFQNTAGNKKRGKIICDADIEVLPRSKSNCSGALFYYLSAQIK